MTTPTGLTDGRTAQGETVELAMDNDVVAARM